MQAPAKFGAADTFRCDLSAEAALSSAGGAAQEAALNSAGSAAEEAALSSAGGAAEGAALRAACFEAVHQPVTSKRVRRGGRRVQERRAFLEAISSE